MPASSPKPRTRLGCGYLLFTLVVTCVLLFINGLIVRNTFFALTAQQGAIHPQLGQTIVFLGPILLLFLEWWSFDVASDWLRPRRPEAGRGPAEESA
jgi:hypothetical protein